MPWHLHYHVIYLKVDSFEDRILGSIFGSKANLLGKYFHVFTSNIWVVTFSLFYRLLS